MRIKQVKFNNKGKVQIKHQVKRPDSDEWDTFTLECGDAPAPGFVKAMREMRKHVIDICEMPEKDLEKIEVTGVNFSYGGEFEIPGAVITAKKRLKLTSAAMIINTPHKPFGPYKPGGSTANSLSDSAKQDLNNLTRHAELYQQGERAETALPMEVEP